MKTIELTGTQREGLGKTNSKHLRRTGNVPCVLYGSGEPVHFSLPMNGLKKAIYTPDTFVVNLQLGGESMKCIIKDSQFHAVKEEVTHVDFLRVVDDVPVEVELPVVLKGTAKGVLAGGKLAQMMRKIRLKGMPSSLPEEVVVDVTKLSLGKTIKVYDLNLPGLTITSPAAAAVAAVNIPRSLKSAGSAAEEEEGDETGDEGGEEESSASE